MSIYLYLFFSLPNSYQSVLSINNRVHIKYATILLFIIHECSFNIGKEHSIQSYVYYASESDVKCISSYTLYRFQAKYYYASESEVNCISSYTFYRFQAKYYKYYCASESDVNCTSYTLYIFQAKYYCASESDVNCTSYILYKSQAKYYCARKLTYSVHCAVRSTGCRVRKINFYSPPVFTVACTKSTKAIILCYS